MKENKVMGSDVDIPELAALTKNFSGAELSGLVKSATSFAFARNIKAGTTASVSDDVVNMKVGRQDFLNALNEVKPAFGTDDAELEDAIPYGIIPFSPSISAIVNDGLLYVENVRQQERLRHTAVLLHGPPASGKTALAAHIAMKSDYPFIKIITPASMVGFRDEAAKKDHLHKIFTDAYKSPLSMLIIGMSFFLLPRPSTNINNSLNRQHRAHHRMEPRRPPPLKQHPPSPRHPPPNAPSQGPPPPHHRHHLAAKSHGATRHLHSL
jgi:vesicle-fusing ATPase